jgi:hypothetical protein
MNNKEIDRSNSDKLDKDLNWATDENWVRSAANLEAETGVDGSIPLFIRSREVNILY